jgi:hypothetical protein
MDYRAEGGNVTTQNRKLYSITLKGFHSYNGKFRSAYVVASDPTAAYKIVREWLDKRNYGFRGERELDTITLMADEYEYSDVGAMLFVAEKEAT